MIFFLFEERESPALWPVLLFNAQIPWLKMPDLAPLVSGDLIHFLSFTAALATALYSLSFPCFLPRQLCTCGLSTARHKPCPKAEADFGWPHVKDRGNVQPLSTARGMQNV